MKFALLAGSILATTLMISSQAGATSQTSSQKLSHHFLHIIPAGAVLVHTRSSGQPVHLPGEQPYYLSLREEWYQDKTGHHWYTWEEKQQMPEGHWGETGTGVAKQGSQAYRGYEAVSQASR
ncbi:hypothetical protein NFHSH190041_10100 [Shewanella sp. NFH-SH190041]|nr:hypothetical protein NFHSH190041_10100 [Shewanella sp. NFH-SH190041]